MANPTPYVPGYSYTDHEEATPTLPPPGAELDNDLAEIAASLSATITALIQIRRSDGVLANQSVGPDQLSAALTLGFTNRGTWAVDTVYSGGDGVAHDGVFYSARVAHTATLGNRPDLSPTTWMQLFSVASVSIPDNSITGAKLQNGIVDENILADGAVVEDKIATNAVTEAKIDALAVTEAKIGALAVTAGKIAALAVETAKIADLAVTTAKLAADSVTDSKILAATITPKRLLLPFGIAVEAQQNAPPGSPTEGLYYVVGTAGTGAFATHNNEIATYISGAWYFFTTYEGSSVINKATGKRMVKRSSGAWFSLGLVLIGTTRFTASGAFVKDTRTVYAEARGCAAGAGGGAGRSTAADTMAGGGGGGSGAWGLAAIVSPSGSYAVTIGTGGVGGASSGDNPGADGGNTSFGAVLVLGGGKGGRPFSVSGSFGIARGGYGGTPTAGTRTAKGSAGGPGSAADGAPASANATAGGVGGSTPYGGGGSGGWLASGDTDSPEAGGGYGSGGGGGAGRNSTSQTGGPGASGYLEVEEWMDAT